MSRTGPWRDWKARIRIPHLLEAIGRLHEFRVRGPRLMGPCPIHHGDNRQAFSVHRERDLWYCFTRCGRGGDVIDLAWLLSDRSWPRAARWLEDLAGTSMSLPPSLVGGADEDRPGPLPAFRPYTRALHLDPSHSFFRRLGLREETVLRFEAGAWYGRGFLEETVAVRLYDLVGNPLGYAGRRLDPVAVGDLGKWKFPPHYPKREGLWNWHRVAPGRPEGLIVVEGPWSVMKLWQAGIGGVVALGGLSVSRVQAHLLARAPKVTLLLDGDQAGESATRRLVADRVHSKIFVVRPPPGTDPADLPETQLLSLLERI